MKKRFIAIKNQADSSTLELYFLDEIADTYDFWTDSVQSKVGEIINQVNFYQPSKIKCVIDSIGGDVYVGIAIYNFLKNTSAKVEVEIIGLAASMAAVISMAANKGKLSIAKNAFMMIHKPEGVTAGTSEDIRQGANLIDKYEQQILDIFSQRTGKSVDNIKALYANGDYWMTGEEAVAQGFADSTFNETQNISIAARLSTEDYTNIPAAIRAQIKPENNSPIYQHQIEDMKKFFTDIVNAVRGVKPVENQNQQDLVNQLATAMNAPFEKVGDEIEVTITNKIDEHFKADKFTTILNAAVKTAVDASTQELNSKIKVLETAKTDLERKNTELQSEITNKIGKQTTSQQTVAQVPIGSYN